ncbi:MAG: hypothetical protein VXX02_04250 [Pseudomonadota bacterium]|nr:hypothetical protein [Pseudomonadota bacterium]MEC7561112.1 hypothetical protein [Pseudomonadota bacterium]MEC7970675.1 hypothetical protein [Pseudomonadota bacterium]MEC8754819.1 hypothetical protein [Pseudomonadota bacterium]MEC9134540.1 hypothetical protein [Pseudomonadota bacterium]
MSSALRMVQPALGKQLTKMNFGGIGDKLKKAQAAQAAPAQGNDPAPTRAKVNSDTYVPLKVLKDAYIPGRDGPARAPVNQGQGGEQPTREQKQRSARRRARRIGRRSLLASSRLSPTDQKGSQQTTLG